MARRTPQRPQYLRYGILLALLFAIRGFEAATQGAIWRARAYDSRIWLYSTLLLAVMVCSLVTVKVRRHYSTTITILLSVLAGATCTLVVSSIPGMMAGLVMGSLMAFEVTRRLFFRSLRYVVRYGLPAGLLGFVTGFVGSRSGWFHVDPPYTFAATLILSFLLVMAICWAVLMAKWQQQRIRDTLLAATVVFLIGVLVEPAGVMWDKRLRAHSLLPSIYTFGSTTIRGVEIFLRGWRGATELGLAEGISAAQASKLRPFHEFHRIWMNDGECSTSGFAELELAAMNELYASGTRLDDASLLLFQESPNVRILELAGTRVTDAGLRATAAMPWLGALNLSNTRINGSGLKHLHPQAPLNVLRLDNTQVDDKALASLAPFQLGHLSLRQTLVQGPGFARLDKRFLVYLDLAHSDFREEFLGHLLPGRYATLNLNGIPLTAAGIHQLGGIRTLNELFITHSPLSDAAVQPLQNLRSLSRLRLDGTLLTPQASEAIAHIAAIELNYDAAGMAIDEIIARYEPLRDAIRQRQQDWSVARPPTSEPPVGIGIRGLTVPDSKPSSGELREITALGPGRVHDVRVGDGEPLPGAIDLSDLEGYLREHHDRQRNPRVHRREDYN